MLLVIKAFGGLLSMTPLATCNITGSNLNGIFLYFNITCNKIVNFRSASAYNAFKPAKSEVLY